MMIRFPRLLPLLAALCCAAGPVAAAEDGLPPDGAPAGMPDSARRYQLLEHSDLDLVQVFSGTPLNWGSDRFAMPVQQQTWQLDAGRTLLVNVLAIQWQHNLNTSNSMTLSARRGSSLYRDTERLGASTTAASLAWDKLFGTDSRLTGRFFAGDENFKEPGPGYADRRYYGMQLVGSTSLWRDHAPFASLKWQRSDYDQPISPGSGALLRSERYSNFAAGWNWQVSPGWDVRAEANYRLNDDSTEPVDADRTQLYFSTHYGFH